MRLVIDLKKCLGSGQCAYLHPDLFDIPDGKTSVVRVEHPGADRMADVEDAITMCPSQAISLVED